MHPTFRGTVLLLLCENTCAYVPYVILVILSYSGGPSPVTRVDENMVSDIPFFAGSEFNC